MRKLCELIFGKAAVVGVRSMLGLDRPIHFEIEIDPATGRETLLSKITRAQLRLKQDPVVITVPGTLDAETVARIKAEWERGYIGRGHRAIIL